MKKIIAGFMLHILTFGAGTIFQRQIGVGTALVSLGVKKEAPVIDTLAPRLASLEALGIPAKSIIFMGDSLIDFQEWNEAFPVYGIINRGVAGAKIQDITGRYDLAQAKAIFCLIGINNLRNGTSFKEFKILYQKYVDSIPETVTLYSISIPAVQKLGEKMVDVSLIEKCNEYIREATIKKGGVYIDIFQISQQGGNDFYVADGIHFSKKAYQEVIAILKPYVENEGLNKGVFTKL